MNLKTRLLIGLVFAVMHTVSATPTVNASNLNFSVIGCKGLTLKWTKGNGTARMIMAKQGSAPTFTPVNSIFYNSYNASFGSSLSYGANNDEYVVYKGNGDSVNISGLNPNNDYYFTIYEFEIGLNGPEYLINSAPTANATTHYVLLSFNHINIDTCEISNLYRYTNTSTSSIPGLKYRFYNNWTDTILSSQTWDVHVSASGYVKNYLTHTSELPGCAESIFNFAKVFPSDMASIDWPNATDTVQVFFGHQFKIPVLAKTMPFPVGITYNWNYGDGTFSNFNRMNKVYNDIGRYPVQLVMNLTQNMKPTACYDTINFTVRLSGYNPYLLIQIAPLTQQEDSNKIYVSISDNNMVYTKWSFGDGDTSLNAFDTHVYDSAGVYSVSLNLTNNAGKKGVYNETIYITKKQKTQLSSLTSKSGISVYPNPLKSILYLDMDNIQAGTAIRIYSLDGQLMLEKTCSENDSFIDVTSLVSGLYTVVVTSHGEKPEVITILK